MAEDQFRDHDAFLRMHFDRDTTTIVIHGYSILLTVNNDFDRVHCGIVDLCKSRLIVIKPNSTHCTHLIIRGIHQNLIKDFKKPRDKCDRPKAV